MSDDQLEEEFLRPHWKAVTAVQVCQMSWMQMSMCWPWRVF